MSGALAPTSADSRQPFSEPETRALQKICEVGCQTALIVKVLIPSCVAVHLPMVVCVAGLSTVSYGVVLDTVWLNGKRGTVLWLHWACNSAMNTESVEGEQFQDSHELPRLRQHADPPVPKHPKLLSLIMYMLLLQDPDTTCRRVVICTYVSMMRRTPFFESCCSSIIISSRDWRYNWANTDLLPADDSAVYKEIAKVFGLTLTVSCRDPGWGTEFALDRTSTEAGRSSALPFRLLPGSWCNDSGIHWTCIDICI